MFHSPVMVPDRLSGQLRSLFRDAQQQAVEQFHAEAWGLMLLRPPSERLSLHIDLLHALVRENEVSLGEVKRQAQQARQRAQQALARAQAVCRHATALTGSATQPRRR